MSTRSPSMAASISILLFVGALTGCEAELPAWQKALPSTAELFPARTRGLRVARGPIHLHSPYSHDACDGAPQVDGHPDPTCLSHLRDGLCETHQDFAMLTDHADLFAQFAWDELFLPGPGDEPVMAGGLHVASKLACPDGHTVLLQIGSENELMPIGLTSHVADTQMAREDVLKGGDAATAAIFRQHGALVAVAHGEAHTIEQLREIDVDATELYNLHANLAPNIREMLGQDPTAPLLAVLPFLGTDGTPDPDLEPDMAFLAFFEENPFEEAKLKLLWQEGRHVLGTLGVDAHENAVPIALQDGERGDSYRRVLRWFSNYLLVSDVTPEGIKEAIGEARGYGVFEVFGAPEGFDFRAEQAGAAKAGIGDRVAFAAGLELVVDVPHAPELRTDDLSIEVIGDAAAGDFSVRAPVTTPQVRVPVPRPGPYRVVVRVTPRAFARHLGKQAALATREFVWIASSPIWVE